MKGNGIFRVGFFRFLFLGFFWAASAGAVPPIELGHQQAYEFQKDNHQLKGQWKGAEQWEGRWCNGYYQYLVDASAVLSTVDFELNDNGTVAVYADLRDLYGGANGVYRSQATLCIPMRGWTGVGLERAEVFSEVQFAGEGENLSDVKVRVVATKLGRLHLGKWVPSWFERFLTNVANRALAKIWSSRLGEWISGKISDIIKKKIPVDAQGELQVGGYRR